MTAARNRITNKSFVLNDKGTNRSGSSGQTLKSRSQPVRINAFCSGSIATEFEFLKTLSKLGGNSELPLAVALHVPFSPYQYLTSANGTIVSHDEAEISLYIDSIELEVKLITERLGSNRYLQQLHLGGAAPNSLSERQLARLLDIIDRYFRIDEHTETSLTADPGRSSFAQLELLNGFGFRQIHYWISDLDKQVQSNLGRVQSTDLVREVFQASREAGFELVTSDLLYGLPHQTTASMAQTVEQYLEISPDRISSRGFRTSAHAGAGPSLADKMAVFNTIVDGLTGDQQYEWIGVDCFARMDDPLRRKAQDQDLKRNRIGYTSLPDAEFLGIGINAISEIGGLCVQNHHGIKNWSDAVEGGGMPIRTGLVMDALTLRRRAAMSDLLCNMESDDAEQLVDEQSGESLLEQYERDGLVTIHEDKIVVTAAGQFFLNQLWEDILPASL